MECQRESLTGSGEDHLEQPAIRSTRADRRKMEEVGGPVQLATSTAL